MYRPQALTRCSMCGSAAGREQVQRGHGVFPGPLAGVGRRQLLEAQAGGPASRLRLRFALGLGARARARLGRRLSLPLRLGSGATRGRHGGREAFSVCNPGSNHGL